MYLKRVTGEELGVSGWRRGMYMYNNIWSIIIIILVGVVKCMTGIAREEDRGGHAEIWVDNGRSRNQ